jgi:methionyl-tRNA formyltransferase
MTRLAVVFFGTPELAVPSVEACAERHDLRAVVCQPDRPRGRGKKLEPPPVKVWAEAQGIEVHQPAKLNDGAFASWLESHNPDVCAIAAYGRLLKQPILDIPGKGFINMHPSLLPKYRGPSPIQSALLNGETETGITIMRLTLEMDAGDILIQERVPIDPNDDGVSLTRKLAGRGGELLADALDRIASGTAEFTPQNDAEASYCRMFKKEDGRIRWQEPAETIHNLIRAAQPWPVAHCGFRGDVYRIHASAVDASQVHAAPGTIVEVKQDRLVVATGDGAIAILAIQAPGKRMMQVGEFLRGHSIEPGERFEDL